ncbi:RHOMBOID-like protein 3 [Zea mays]|uniref:RHOMBOID-like protein n=1 Tax=Zea mays TaxID=4577 RepID=A0A3L6G381_MAIZE|nr:RHOMBOID-like protein 3 [Zea mays]
MASDGDGKGRVATAPGAGGYGYGYGYAGFEGEEDRKWWPWLVPTVIVACIAVFVVEMYENNCPKNRSQLGGDCVAGFLRRFSFQPLRENPLLGPSSSTLEKMGALDWNKIVHQNQGWRLISCIWLHAGLIHLVVNMLSLLFIGIRLEQQFGFAAIITLLFIIALNLAIGILPHADNFAHIGGFATGFLLGFVLLARPQFGWMEHHELPQTNQPPKYKAYQYILWVVALVLLLVGFVISLVMLFKGKNGNDGCHWCHYLNCVPTSKWKCNT